MPLFTKDALARRSDAFRYCHFLITGVRFMRFSVWKDQGKPNPFVLPPYRQRMSHRANFSAVISDSRSPVSHFRTGFSHFAP